MGVFRGVLAGDDSGSGVSAAVSSVWRRKFSDAFVLVFVDELGGVCESSRSMDGSATS